MKINLGKRWKYLFCFVDNFVYYYSISFKRERETACASGFALGTRVNEKMISPSLPFCQRVLSFFLDNFVYYYSISFKGEKEPAYASGFALGAHVNEKWTRHDAERWRHPGDAAGLPRSLVTVTESVRVTIRRDPTVARGAGARPSTASLTDDDGFFGLLPGTRTGRGREC